MIILVLSIPCILKCFFVQLIYLDPTLKKGPKKVIKFVPKINFFKAKFEEISNNKNEKNV